MRGGARVWFHAPVLALALLAALAWDGSAGAQQPPPEAATDARPTVRFTGLFTGATLQPGRPTVLTAAASDDVGIAGVRFLRDFEELASDTTAPYEFSYTPTAPDRAELLTVEARDTAGQVSQTSIAVRIAAPPTPREDRPPSVVLDAPADKQLIPVSGIRLRARAVDDRGVTLVRFLYGARTVCDDRTAPYECLFRPRSADVGRVGTFLAVAVDDIGQTQGAIRDARVARYDPLAMTMVVGRARRSGKRYRFTVRGRVKLPDAIRVSRGCVGGKVRVRARRDGKTAAIEAPILDRTCRYRTTLTVRSRGRVRFSAGFQGNALVGTKNASTVDRRAG